MILVKVLSNQMDQRMRCPPRNQGSVLPCSGNVATLATLPECLLGNTNIFFRYVIIIIMLTLSRTKQQNKQRVLNQTQKFSIMNTNLKKQCLNFKMKKRLISRLWNIVSNNGTVSM